MVANNKDLNKICGILLAKAIVDLYPNALIGSLKIGDDINNEIGYTYLFDLEERISNTNFPKIIKQMKKNIDRNYEIKYEKVSKQEANELFKNNKYKLELLSDYDSNEIEIIKFGNDFVDLCEQLSIEKLSAIKIIDLLNIGGVY
jgi:threonyl-tRNA synthetase